jgi:hypothetical protein
MTDALKALPDYPSLEQLARALWRNGTVRGAAVLVGAGFSRNANRPAADTPIPPLWNDLLNDLIAQLYSDAPDDAPKGALRIAEEYRTFFGQAALDDFIRSRFPDRAWLPGTLHDDLLALPWSDVLTTNWDTLLERAAENARDLQYDVVRYEADLPHARAPRIVKLHGTIGDPGPLIFAEEDYRTYPAKHAAYVNLARQIFIENELCLIGFSGDDPNFLQWAGWVRDQLGGNARRIYLVGNLNLPRATRKFLEAHNIAPIDLAPLVAMLPKTDQHAAAARHFFDALTAAKPHPAGEWRRVSLKDYPMHQASMHQAGGDVHLRARKDDAFAATLLDDTAVVLAKDRATYPGWLVCPRTERPSLSRDEPWILRAATLAILKPERRVEVLAEILWRRTVGLYPLDEELVTLLGGITETWPDGLDMRPRWEFAVALMRDARIDDKAEVFAKWAKLVEEMVPADSLQREETLYQKCLRARDTLDYHGLQTLLPQLRSDDPLWQLRRAALHAELGEFAKATRLIKEAAVTLEKAYRLGRTSLWIKARLGWADWLAYLTDMARVYSPTYSPREFKDLKIDPQDEILRIRNEARDIANKHFNEEGVQPAFEPGHYRDGGRSIRIGGGDPKLLLSFELDQLIDTVGLPLRINNVDVCAGTVVETAGITYQQTAAWYLRLLRGLHSNSDRPFTRFFSRVPLAQLTSEVAEALIDKVGKAIDFWLGRVKASQHLDMRDDRSQGTDRLRLMIYAYSHLTVRMTPDAAQATFLRAVAIARDPDIRHPWLLEALGQLATRAAAAVPPDRQSALCLATMEFPLAAEKGTQDHFWPKIVTAIWATAPARPVGDPKWQTRIADLIAASWKGGYSRPEAVLRLSYLDEHNGLTSEERTAFGNALWSELSEGPQPLPARADVLASSFINLPAPDGVDVAARVRHHVIDAELTPLLSQNVIVDSRIISDIQNHLIALHNTKPLGITIEPNRAAQLFDQMAAWRSVSGDRQDPFSLSFSRSFSEGVQARIGEALSVAIVPAMSAGDRTLARGEALLTFINSVKSWRSLSALVEFVSAAPDLRDAVIVALRRGLIGTDHQQSGPAAFALVHWASLAKNGLEGGLPRTLVERLVATIERRPQHGLSSMLNAMTRLIEMGMYNPSDLPPLLQALGDLRIETRYEAIEIDSEEAISVSLVRKECVGLALALQPIITDDGTLAGWLEDAMADPLPEVRFRLDETDG